MPRIAGLKPKARKSVRRLPKVVQNVGKGLGAYTFKGKGSYSDGQPRGPLERVGRNLGTRFGKWLGGWTGTGDYTNADGAMVLAPEPPRMTNNYADNSIVITHREYLGDLISSATAGAFSIQSFGINPGDPNTFPWLNNVCQPNFQQFKFEQCMFEFRSFSADALNSTNTALGAVFSCVNYDYSDSVPVSRYMVENTDWSRSAKPSESFIVPVECDPKQTGLNGGLLYVLNGNNVPTGNDPKTFYLGRMSIGSTGVQGASVNLGSIFISYRVRIYKPIMTAPASNALISTLIRSGCTQVGNAHLGTALTANVQNCDSIGLTLSGNVLTINRKRLVVGQVYILIMAWDGASTVSCSQPNVAYSTNAEGAGLFNSYTDATTLSPIFGQVNTSTRFLMNLNMIIRDNSQNVTVTFTGGVLPTASVLSFQMMQICGLKLADIGFFDPLA